MTTQSFAVRFGIGAISLALAIPLPAFAGGGGPITAHALTIKIKAVSQTTNSSDDDRPDSTGANQKDVFQTCVGTAPTKTQGIYLFLDCSNLANTINAIDTDPLFDTNVPLGEISFDLGHMVTTTKKGVLTKAIVPVEIVLSCNADATHVDAFGIMTINYTPLGSSPACPSSASVSVIGTGLNPLPGDFILNNGSSISAAKRSGAISTFPPAP